MAQQQRPWDGSPQRRQREGDQAAAAPAPLCAQPTANLCEAPKAERKAEGVGSRMLQLSGRVVLKKRKAEVEATGTQRGPAPPSWGAWEPCPRPSGASSPSRLGASGAVVKQERLSPEQEDRRSRRGRHDGQHRGAACRQAREARSSDPDAHRGPSRRRRGRRSSGDRPGSGPPRGGQRDGPNPQARQAGRELHEARGREEHRQKSKGRHRGGGARESLPVRPGNEGDPEVPVQGRASFELSGALLRDANAFRGVLIKYREPPEARIPRTRWRLYAFKNAELLPILRVHRQSAYLLGRHRGIADIPLHHPSCSKQHAVLQYRLVAHTRADGTVRRRVKPYVMDLGSGNGTFLNSRRIEPQRYYELRAKDVLQFGFSTREYVLLHECSHASEPDGEEDAQGHGQEVVPHGQPPEGRR